MRPAALYLTALLALSPVVTVARAQSDIIRTCALVDGAFRSFYVHFDPTTGDTLTFKKRPFGRVYPANDPGYAHVSAWYVKGEPITVAGFKYVKYGLPRVLGVDEVSLIAEFKGVGVYSEDPAAGLRPDVIYLPVRIGCEFQPYQLEARTAEFAPVPTVAAKIIGSPLVVAGTTSQGELTTSDYVADDNSYYDDFFYRATGSETVTFTVASTAFNTYLLVGQNEEGVLDAFLWNDDYGRGTNSRLDVKFNRAGNFVIRVNSLLPRETGAYTLTVSPTR